MAAPAFAGTTNSQAPSPAEIRFRAVSRPSSASTASIAGVCGVPATSTRSAIMTCGALSPCFAAVDLSSDAIAYSWDFGDGQVSTDENPSNVFTNAGNYTVSLTAFGSENTNTLTRVNYIVVETAPPLVLTGVLSGASFVLSFESVAGKTYDVEYKDTLNDLSWQFLQAVSGDGSTIQVTNFPATSGERYFRVKTQ